MDPTAPPPDPRRPTEPIRPMQGGTEPIPERVRQPIVVPHEESTIGGLPRPLVLALVVGLVIALLLGFFLGRVLGGDDEEATTAERTGRRAACSSALSLALQLAEARNQALTNRNGTVAALASGDTASVQDLSSEYETLASAIAQIEPQVTAAAERCQEGGGRGKQGGKGKKKGGNGGGG